MFALVVMFGDVGWKGIGGQTEELGSPGEAGDEFK